MNIQEATKKAVVIDGYITGGRKEFKNTVFIKPMDGNGGCIVCINKDNSRRGWQPYAGDLMSDNWEVVTKEDFLSLSLRERRQGNMKYLPWWAWIPQTIISLIAIIIALYMLK